MRTIIAANWKMNKTRSEAASFAGDLAKRLVWETVPRDVLIFAPFTALADTYTGFNIAGNAVEIGAQDVYPETEGAFTGEISPAMIRDCGATWVLTGHSERRHIIHEDNELVAKKTAFALKNGLHVMLCIGETLKERDDGLLESVLEKQISSVASVADPALLTHLAVAYEPVWAIGTGKVASENDIAATHGIVRDLLIRHFNADGQEIPILYGGSVKAGNAGKILTLDNVNGVLVGGASLSVESFEQIVRA